MKNHRITKACVAVLAAYWLFSAFGQASAQEAGSTGFPAMAEFHEVMARFWHKHYPNKDVEAVREEIDMLVERTDKLEKASLPEIYQHRKAAFTKKMSELSKLVDDLRTLSKNGDDKEILTAVEDMHKAFHGLVQSIHSRPMELDELHAVIYQIRHNDYPSYDFASLKKRMPLLKQKVKKAREANLARFKNVPKSKYNAGMMKLSVYAGELATACSENREDDAWQAVEALHEQYVKVDSLFDA